MSPLLSIDHLSMAYHSPAGETLALQEISLQIRKGEFVCLVGPSGCGKSTLLTAIAGLDTTFDGTITCSDDIQIGYMFQRDELLEWRTVMENACLGLEIQKKLTPEAQNDVLKLIDSYGLSEFKNRYPSELSGGMRQRAALIRTMALKPELVLLDEPFSALDYQTRLSVSDEIWHILKDAKKTAIMVTHDISEAISLGDRVVILSPRPGRILQDVPIHFDGRRGPLDVRKNPQFQTYFHEIWEVMKHD